MRGPAIKLKLWKEILFVLFFKITLLFAIWYCWFRDPIEKHLTVERVAEQLVGKQVAKG